MEIFYIFYIIVLLYSIILHEYAHGWMAEQLGDPTARQAGRLTLNPLPHLDPIGSILLPGLLILTNSPFLLGWARPVPFNPLLLRDQKYGPLKVALAGPLANFSLALIFGLLLRFLSSSVALTNFSLAIFAQLLAAVVWLNLLLMIFNLIPIPPLDGSKILLTFLPFKYQYHFYRWEQYGMILLFILIFALFNFVVLPIMVFFFKIITGVSPFLFF